MNRYLYTTIFGLANIHFIILLGIYVPSLFAGEWQTVQADSAPCGIPQAQGGDYHHERRLGQRRPIQGPAHVPPAQVLNKA